MTDRRFSCQHHYVTYHVEQSTCMIGEIEYRLHFLRSVSKFHVIQKKIVVTMDCKDPTLCTRSTSTSYSSTGTFSREYRIWLKFN